MSNFYFYSSIYLTINLLSFLVLMTWDTLDALNRDSSYSPYSDLHSAPNIDSTYLIILALFLIPILVIIFFVIIPAQEIKSIFTD